MTTRARALALAALLLAGCGEAGGARARPPLGTEVGNAAPPLAGRLASGEPFELRPGGDSAHVLVFYRGAECGLCRVRLERLQAHAAEYRRLGAALLAVAPDEPAVVARTAREVGASFPILSVDTATLRRWGVVDSAGAPTRPATLLIDEAGVVRFRHVGRNAADRASDPGILVLLARMRNGSGADAAPSPEGR